MAAGTMEERSIVEPVGGYATGKVRWIIRWPFLPILGQILAGDYFLNLIGYRSHNWL